MPALRIEGREVRRFDTETENAEIELLRRYSSNDLVGQCETTRAFDLSPSMRAQL